MNNARFEDRRQSSSSGFAALMEMVKETNVNVNTLRTEIADGLTSQRLALDSAMADAFPEGDPVGHRKHHEAVIKAAEDRAKFWETMRTEIAKYGLVGFVGWATYSLWTAFLQGPHK